MSIFKAPSANFVSTSLNGSINDIVGSITLNDASLLQYPGYVVIDREDGNGNPTPSSREIVSFTGITSNTLTGCTRGADGSTARSHNSGALVEATITVGMWEGLRAAYGGMTDDGTQLHLANATITSVLKTAGFIASSVASVSRSEFIQMALSSIASIQRAEIPFLQVNTSSTATGYIDALTVKTSLNISGASTYGFQTPNLIWQVSGGLASYQNVGGMMIMPKYGTAKDMIAYVQTPSSIASVSAFVVKQGGVVVGMLGILGAGTYGSSASLAVTALVPGDNLTLDIRSTASLASDLTLLLRTV